MVVTKTGIARGIEALQLGGLPVCIHSSLKSFSHVNGGAEAIIDAFLDAACTVIVPTFSYSNEVAPPDGITIKRNGWNEDRAMSVASGNPKLHDPDSNNMSTEDMGLVPLALIQRPDRIRGMHPIDSFSAVGQLAEEIISTQTAQDVYGPLRAIGEYGGDILLMGVGLNRMTLLHTAEQDSGRGLFHRWVLGSDGDLIESLVGGCSEGFHALEPVIGHLARETSVGSSHWRAFPVQPTLEAAALAIRTNPEITHCKDPDCTRCNDAVQGGPIVS